MPQKIEELQEELRREKEKFNNLFELNPYSIGIYDAEGHFVRANKAFHNLFRVDPPVGMSMFKDDPIMKKNSEYYHKILGLREGKSMDFDNLRFNPHEIFPQLNLPNFTIWLHIAAFPVYDASGKIINYIMIQEDITKRKHAEQKLQEKIEEQDKTIKLTVGRELHLIELKNKIAELEKENDELKKKDPEKHLNKILNIIKRKLCLVKS